jgi:hypothetical protein
MGLLSRPNKYIEGFKDLSKRPVLLDMIVKTLPMLLTSGKIINRPNLYELYLKGEIQRQKILKRRQLLLSEDIRFELLKVLALDFYIGKIQGINFNESLKNRITSQTSSRSIRSVHRDFLNCSFLIRERYL